MKKGLWVALAVSMLVGCVSAPAANVPAEQSTISSTADPIPTPILVTSPATKNSITIKPTSTEAPDTPSPLPTATSTPAPKEDTVTDDGYKIGFIVTKNHSVFYLDRQYSESGTKHSVYSFNTETNQKRKLREFRDTPITQIFLDGAGNLYYVKSIYTKDSDNQVTIRQNLYQYTSGQDRLIASYIDSVIRVDQTHIFYIGPSGSIYQYHVVNQTKTKVAQVSLEDKNLYVSYFSCLGYFLMDVRNTTDAEYQKYHLINLYTGKTSLLSEKPEDRFIGSDDGKCLIKYSHSGKKTMVTIYDMKTGETSKFSISGSLWIDRAFVQSEIVNLVATSGISQKDTLYQVRMPDGKVQTKTNLPYHIGSSVAYNGTWYFYTYVFSTHDDTEYTKQSIKAMALKDGRITKLHNFEQTVDNGHDLRLDIANDILWLDYYGSENQSHSVISRFLIK